MTSESDFRFEIIRALAKLNAAWPSGKVYEDLPNYMAVVYSENGLEQFWLECRKSGNWDVSCFRTKIGIWGKTILSGLGK